MKTLPEIVDVGTDLLFSAPQLKVTINRDNASRFGISAQAIDDTLNDAYGQRQITQYFTQLNTYWIILEILPDLQQSLESLDRIYVKSPLTGAAVPLSALIDVDSYKTGPLSINHQGQFPAATLTFNLRAGVALGEAVDSITKAAREIGMPSSVIGTFQGNAQAFQSSLSSEPALIAAALVVVYIILGMLYESFIHPLTILSTLPRHRLRAAPAARLLHCRRPGAEPIADALHDTGRLSLPRAPAVLADIAACERTGSSAGKHRRRRGGVNAASLPVFGEGKGQLTCTRRGARRRS
jgi:multidrug efflux pump subunit AcrB